MVIVRRRVETAQTRRFSVHRGEGSGWHIREEHGAMVVASAHYVDWHRVERARLRFERGTPAGDGWIEEGPATVS